jgi:hypothetical protein
MAGTQEWGLSFDMSGSKEQGLLGYSDSSFGDCPDTGRSTLAYVFLYQNATLSWYSKLNTFVTLSTNHAEYAALAIAAREAEWLVTLFDELEPGLPTTPVPINVDNTGVVSLVFNPVDHATNKHVKLSCHYARELTERKIIFPVRVASTNNLADLFTKALPPPTFNSFARQVVQPKIETRTIMLMQAHSEQSPRTKQTSRRNPNNTSTRQKLPSPTLSQSPTQAAHQVETKSEPKGKISLAPPTPTLTCMGCHSISSPQYCMITCAQCKASNFQWTCKCVVPEANEPQSVPSENAAQSDVDSEYDEPAQQQTKSTFFEDWPYVSRVKAELSAERVEICETGETFTTGRKKYNAIFFAADKTEISKHLAMRLLNKAGAPYMVCQRKPIQIAEVQPPTRTRARGEQPARSYTQQIFFTPPGKAGVLYHHQDCDLKASCVQASIEYAYAMRMKPAPCCFDSLDL